MKKPVWSAALMTLIVLWIGLLCRQPCSDDAYIAFRCARNLAAGHGLVFNPGERVESASNFLFAVAIGLGIRTTGLDPEEIARILNHIALFYIFYLLCLSALRNSSLQQDFRWRSIGVALVALNVPIWYYAHSGMETITFAALLFGGFYSFGRWMETGRFLAWAGVLFGLAAGVRMEAALFVSLSIVMILWMPGKKQAMRSILILALPFILIFLPVLAFRWHYYGYPFPNAYYAKVDGGSIDLLVRGFRYSLRWFLISLPVTASLFAGIAILLSRSGLKERSVLGCGWILCYGAYNSYVGGDFFPYGRFFVPLIPIAGWMLIDQVPLFIHHVQEKKKWSEKSLYRLASGFVLVAFCLSGLNPTDLKKGIRQNTRSKVWREIGITLYGAVPPDTMLYLAPAGAMPYFSGLPAYDMLGLADPVVAHKKMRLGNGPPGHEKVDFDRLKELKPDLIFFGHLPKDMDMNAYYMPILEELEKPVRLRVRIPNSKERAGNSFKVWKKWFLSDPFSRQYDLMCLDGEHLDAAFMVRKDGSPNLRSAFTPFRKQPSESQLTEKTVTTMNQRKK